MKGLTLLEILLAMGIAIVVGMFLLIVIVNSSGLFLKQSSKVEGGLNINDALLQVRTSIKDASAVLGSYTSVSTTYTTGNTVLVLKIPTINSSNNIITETFDYYVFFQDQKKLRFKTFPDPSSSRKAQDQIFSTNVDSLVFEYFNSANPPVEVVPALAKKVRISLTLKQKSGASYEINTATSEANLRND